MIRGKTVAKALSGGTLVGGCVGGPLTHEIVDRDYKLEQKQMELNGYILQQEKHEVDLKDFQEFSEDLQKDVAFYAEHSAKLQEKIDNLLLEGRANTEEEWKILEEIEAWWEEHYAKLILQYKKLESKYNELQQETESFATWMETAGNENALLKKLLKLSAKRIEVLDRYIRKIDTSVR